MPIREVVADNENPQPLSPAPGYYPDPNGQSRWWDGQRWTDRLAPTPATAPVPQAPAAVRATGAAAPTVASSATPVVEPASSAAPRRTLRPVPALIAGAAAVALFAGGYLTGTLTSGSPAAAAAGDPSAASGSTEPASSAPTPAATPSASPTPSTPAPPAMVTIAGTFTVIGLYQRGHSEATIEISADGSSCTGTGPYSDATEGATVTVYDAAGTIVGTGALGHGTGERMWGEDTTRSEDLYYGPCVLPFTLEVPDSDFYQVEVSHRGKTTVQRADAGAIALTLGS